MITQSPQPNAHTPQGTGEPCGHHVAPGFVVDWQLEEDTLELPVAPSSSAPTMSIYLDDERNEATIDLVPIHRDDEVKIRVESP